MLTTTIERLADDKLRLDVEVPAADVQAAVDHTLQDMAQTVRLPGFRPGKVPPAAVLARMGRDHVVAEALSSHLDDWYRSAVAASGIRPVAAPEVDLGDLPAQGGTFKFNAVIEVAKPPKLPELSTLEVERPKRPDTAPLIEQVLEATLRGAGTLEASSEGATQGDEVVVDFTCAVDGLDVEGASATGYQARLGDGRLLEELEAAIIGQTSDSQLDVPVDFPADHPMSALAGQHAAFTLKVREVLRMDLPELTDDLARQLSEFDSAQALRDDVEASIIARLDNEIDGIFRANSVRTLGEKAEVEHPAALVERRQQEAYAELKGQLDRAGLSIEQYLAGSGQDMTELFAQLETTAKDEVARELSLLALAEIAKIEITEADLRKEITEHAEATGEDVEETITRVLGSPNADLLRGELLIQRTIDHLVKSVKPVEVDLPTAEEQAEAAAKAADAAVAEAAAATPDAEATTDEAPAEA